MNDYDFCEAEYKQRLSNLRQKMSARELDVLIIDQFEHLVYLFGYLPTAAKYQACLLPRAGTPHMIVRSMDRAVFQAQSWLSSWTEFADHEEPIEVMCAEIRSRYGDGLRVGIEADSHILTVERYLRIKELLADSEVVECSGQLAEMRLIKSASEINYLRRAASIADEGMAAALKVARVGVAEREAIAAAYSAAIEAGADNGRVLLSASGKQADSIHGRLGCRVLEDGDIFHLELVPQVRGYSARVMRPTFIGTPDPDAVSLAKCLVSIQDEQIAAIRPGVSAQMIDKIARDRILGEGLAEAYHNHTGYTLGYHAQPRTSDHTRIFVPSAEWALAPGMVFHMFIAVRGVAFGDTVLVTDEGHEQLTRTARTSFFK